MTRSQLEQLALQELRKEVTERQATEVLSTLQPAVAELQVARLRSQGMNVCIKDEGQANG